MTTRCAAIIAALFIWICADAAGAGDVTLTSRDGSVSIGGTLLGFDGEFYRVDTVYGTLTVDGSGVLCEGTGCPDMRNFAVEFTIAGSRTMGEILLPALVESFATRTGYLIERRVTDDDHFVYLLKEATTGRQAATIRFRVNSTAEGFADMLADEADIVLAMRPATDGEIAFAREAGLGDLANPRRRRILALDALVPIVSPANPLREVTMQALADIYSGAIDNWSALGGPEAAISVHLRDRMSGVADEFERRVLAASGKTLADRVIRHPDNAHLADQVASDPTAIGIATISDIGNARSLAIAGGCGMVSAADEVAIKREEYPLTTPLFIYTPARRLPLLAREFLAFVRSPPAQAVIDRAGFIDLHLRESAVAEQGQRLANAIAAAGDDVPLEELQRLVTRMRKTRLLSLSFRFAIGGTELDAQSVSSVGILAKMLEDGAFDGRKLVFVGFSDGEGPAVANLRLARRRAQSVRDAVMRAAPMADRERLDVTVDAFGEAMPLACDSEDWGRQMNRRVEVWAE